MIHRKCPQSSDIPKKCTNKIPQGKKSDLVSQATLLVEKLPGRPEYILVENLTAKET
jgi:hypothetical protein